MEYLVDVIQKLSLARTLEEVIEITRHAARELTGADGATFILRDGNHCHYVDEDAVGPLWKGKRFPLETCVSGWAMLHHEAVVIEDIYQDPRVPIDAYRPTFVKSLAMIPIREQDPIGAIGNYWATKRKASEKEIELLRALANSTAIAVQNIKLIDDLESAKQSLENSLRSRDEFLAIVSHELRTPLSTFKLQLQLADRAMKKSATPMPSLEIAINQSSHLNLLIERLLDVSRIQLDQLELYYSDFDFSEKIKLALGNLKPSLDAAGCTVTEAFTPTIAGEWDVVRLTQIVTNLISNVCKYAAGKSVKISTRVDTVGNAILSIHDDGPGIPPEALPHIFNRFERGISSEHVSGLGLGLFITQQLVNRHGGSIRAISEPGQGTEFIVELPLRKPTLQKGLNT